MNQEIKIIYEETRTAILQIRRISKSIKKIDHEKLNETLYGMIEILESELMLFFDFVIAVESCETDIDLNTLLDWFSGPDKEKVN